MNSADMADLSDLPPLHVMMGFDSKEVYERAFAEYTNYCENILGENESAPSFREYTFGSGSSAGIMEGLNLQKELSGVESLEEARAVTQKIISNYNSSLEEEPFIPVEELFRELILKGPLKAKRAVVFDKKNANLQDIRKTPVVIIAQAVLEVLVQNGSDGNSRDDLIDMESLVEILNELLGNEIEIKNKQGVPVIAFWYRFVNIVLFEKGYICYENESITITDKGLKLLGNKGVRTSYFQFLVYITEKLNWFFNSDLHEEVEDLQNIAGLSLFVMNELSQHSQYVTAEEILGTVDSVYHILPELEKVNIESKKAFEIFDDYFLNGYCMLMGFVRRGPDSTYEPSELFFQLFDWLL